MYYLGITSLYHDPAACLIEDNKIVAMAEEERFSLSKHARGEFPWRAIDFCLKKAGIGMMDVDKIGFYFNPSFKNLFVKRKIIYKNPLNVLGTIYYRKNILNNPVAGLKKYFGSEKKIHYIDHHKTHAASAFYVSGFQKAAVLTMDGAGEATATGFYLGNGAQIEELQDACLPNSLGAYYTCFTEWLGFEPNEGEGKVMGLAPYGSKYLDVFNKILQINKNSKIPYRFNSKILNFNVGRLEANYREQLISFIGNPRGRGELSDHHKNVAYSLQKRLEEAALALTEKITSITSSKNLCIAGGVGLNCKMNGVLLASGLIEDIFVQPAAYDAGCALGAALTLAVEDGHKFQKMDHAYYGSEYTDESIKKSLDMAKIKYEYHKDIAGIVGDMLAKDKIVAWFQGRMEWGARALGNRSILANPCSPKIKDRINYHVKHREPFRPFCPSILEEKSKDYGVNNYLPFMIVATQVPIEKRNEIPGVVHVDGSIRPQTVRKSINPTYHKVISQFYKNTGIPVLLNTSLNIKGQPIIENPKQALSLFYSEGVDALAIGNYLVKK